MRCVGVLTFVPHHPHREALELDGRRELTQAEHRTEPRCDARRQRQHDIGLAHHMGCHEKVRDLERYATALAQLGERGIDDAPGLTTWRHERVRKRHEVLERQPLLHERMPFAHEADELVRDDALGAQPRSGPLECELGIAELPLARFVSLRPMVGTKDIGLVAARSLAEGPPSKKTDVIELAGPRDYSSRDIAATLSRILGKPVEVQAAPIEAVAPTFMGFGTSADVAALYREMIEGIANGRVAFEGGQGARALRGNDDAEEVLRRLLAKS